MTPDHSTKRALVIDDDENIREVLQTLLEIEGFEVDTLRDGIDAVESALTLSNDPRLCHPDGDRCCNMSGAVHFHQLPSGDIVHDNVAPADRLKRHGSRSEFPLRPIRTHVDRFE